MATDSTADVADDVRKTSCIGTNVLVGSFPDDEDNDGVVTNSLCTTNGSEDDDNDDTTELSIESTENRDKSQ